MPSRPWRCPNCHESLGDIAGSELRVTMPGALIERTQTGTVVHCRCGRSMYWLGRVVLNERALSGYRASDTIERKSS